MGPSVEPAWHGYITVIGEESASILVDAAAAGIARDKLSHLLTLRLRALELRDNGFPSKDDFEPIYSLEDRIQETIPASECRYVGRITVGGAYFLHFYSEQPQLHETQIRKLAAPLAERKPALRVREEPGWDTYREVLCPTPEEWQRIMDEKVLDSLRSHGDDLSRPRRVDHWLYFGDEATCRAVADRLTGKGFEIVKQHGPDKDNERWTLQVWRHDSVQPQDITPLTVSLLHLAQEFGGDYDGWGTSVAK